MTRAYLARPQVKRDLIRHARYIAQDNEAAAIRFRHVAEATFEIVTVTPRGYALVKALQEVFPGLRFRPLGKPFQDYLAFYFVADTGEVEFTRVLHGKRDIPRVFAHLRE